MPPTSTSTELVNFQSSTNPAAESFSFQQFLSYAQALNIEPPIRAALEEIFGTNLFAFSDDYNPVAEIIKYVNQFRPLPLPLPRTMRGGATDIPHIILHEMWNKILFADQYEAVQLPAEELIDDSSIQYPVSRITLIHYRRRILQHREEIAAKPRCRLDAQIQGIEFGAELQNILDMADKPWWFRSDIEREVEEIRADYNFVIDQFAKYALHKAKTNRSEFLLRMFEEIDQAALYLPRLTFYNHEEEMQRRKAEEARLCEERRLVLEAHQKKLAEEEEERLKRKAAEATQKHTLIDGSEASEVVLDQAIVLSSSVSTPQRTPVQFAQHENVPSVGQSSEARVACAETTNISDAILALQMTAATQQEAITSILQRQDRQSEETSQIKEMMNQMMGMMMKMQQQPPPS